MMEFAGAVGDPFDGPEIAAVLASLVSAAAAVTAAAIANRTRQHSKVVREQVENEHQNAANPNLREDLDAKDTVVNRKLDSVIETQGHMREDILILRQGWRTNREDIDGLMDTDRKRREQSSWAPPPQSRRERREGRYDY